MPGDEAVGGRDEEPEEAAVSWRRLWLEAAEALGGTPAAANEARWIAEEVSGNTGTAWALGLDEPATARHVSRFDRLVARRREGEPLAYVLGSWGFRRLDVLVDRRVLIPRPETETVVEVALECVRRSRSQPAAAVVAADLGTGSGVIALSLAAELPLDGTSVWATDVSADALHVARANLAGLGRPAANVRLAEGSWYQALPEELQGRLDLVVSNPPYVADDDPLLEPDVREWEPASALFAGADGLDAVRVLVHGATTWLREGGWLVVEIGADQREAARALAGAAGLVEVEVRPDLAGRDRVLVARRPHH